jgi:hypothetical protein
MQLPPQHERAVFEELILFEIAGDPPPTLDRLDGATSHTSHGGCAWPHASLVDRAFPCAGSEEALQRLHLRSDIDRFRNRGNVAAGAHDLLLA